MDDQELVELLMRQDGSGADELLHSYGPMLRYIIAAILSDPREREECLNDVVMRVWDRIGQYAPERGRFPSDGGGTGADPAVGGGPAAPAPPPSAEGTGR